MSITCTGLSLVSSRLQTVIKDLGTGTGSSISIGNADATSSAFFQKNKGALTEFLSNISTTPASYVISSFTPEVIRMETKAEALEIILWHLKRSFSLIKNVLDPPKTDTPVDTDLKVKLLNSKY
jgi:hypothetical protein